MEANNLGGGTRGGADLRSRVLEVIGRGSGAPLPEDEFERFALEVFRHQFECNPIYGAFCEKRGAKPGSVARAQDIPAVPTEAFRAAPLLCGGDPAAATVVFRTSGTSAGEAGRGSHYLLDTRLYRAALLSGFRTYLIPDRSSIQILSLVASAADVSDSSLSFMMSTILGEFGGAGSDFFVSGSATRFDDLIGAMHHAQADSEPVLIAGTSFAFVHLLDHLEEIGEHFSLPAGSRAMDTGGFKGRSREVGRAELYGGIERLLGIPADWIVNEYGMTEMSSQFYDGVVGRAGTATGRLHRSPPWVRTTAVDPDSLQPLPLGKVGILRHLDLANLDSVAALQTADLGRVTDDGIEVLGRSTGAEPRGCSIAMDEMMELLERGRSR